MKQGATEAALFATKDDIDDGDLAPKKKSWRREKMEREVMRHIEQQIVIEREQKEAMKTIE